MRRKHNPWLESPNHTALVPIPESCPTHSLHAHITGPPRVNPEQPMLVWITGAGGPSALYVALQRHLTDSLNIRCLFYDRAGYDRSTRDSSPDKKRILATDSAKDLWDLLEASKIKGSIILAAHSFGGIIAREFLQLVIDRDDDNSPKIAGILLFDCATELMLQLFPRIPSKELMVIAEDVDFEGITNLIEESGLTDEEVQYIMEALDRTIPAARDEDTHASGRLLAEKGQLDRRVMTDGSLVVVGTNMASDYKLLYDEGLKLGNGTKEERKLAKDFIETFGLYQKQIGRAQLDLRLSNGKTRYVFLDEIGHDAPLRIKRADYVGEHVRWMLDQLDIPKGPTSTSECFSYRGRF